MRSWLTSVGPERVQRIDPRRPHRRDQAREARDDRERARDADVDERIERLHVEEQRLDQPGRAGGAGEPDDEADADQLETVAHDQTDDLSGLPPKIAVSDATMR